MHKSKSLQAAGWGKQGCFTYFVLPHNFIGNFSVWRQKSHSIWLDTATDFESTELQDFKKGAVIWEGIASQERFPALRTAVPLIQCWPSLGIYFHCPWRGMVLESSILQNKPAALRMQGGKLCSPALLLICTLQLKPHTLHEYKTWWEGAKHKMHRWELASANTLPASSSSRAGKDNLQLADSSYSRTSCLREKVLWAGTAWTFAPTSLTKRLWAFLRASSGTVDWTVLLCRLMTESCKEKGKMVSLQTGSPGFEACFE